MFSSYSSEGSGGRGTLNAIVQGEAVVYLLEERKNAQARGTVSSPLFIEDQLLARINKALKLENAQRTVESRNYQTRKNVLEYDDVMNVQRKIIYDQRQQVLDGEDLQKNIQSMMKFVVDTHVASAFGEQQHLTDRAQFAELLSHFENVCFAKGEWLVSDEELPKLFARMEELGLEPGVIAEQWAARKAAGETNR